MTSNSRIEATVNQACNASPMTVGCVSIGGGAVIGVAGSVAVCCYCQSNCSVAKKWLWTTVENAFTSTPILMKAPLFTMIYIMLSPTNLIFTPKKQVHAFDIEPIQRHLSAGQCYFAPIWNRLAFPAFPTVSNTPIRLKV